MFEKLSAQDVSNSVSMLRSAFKGTFLVVEGVTDSRFYGKFADRDGVRTVIAYSKDNVRRVVTEIRSRGDRAIMGIVDPDLDRLEGRKCLPPLFMTDNRDLESMILKSKALDDVLAEYAEPDLLKKFESENGSVRDAVLRAAYPIGLLMFISKRDSLGLCFKDLEYRTFIDGRTLRIDVRKMMDAVFAASAPVNVSRKALAESIQAEEELLDDPWDAVRGHDAVAILCIGMGIFGSYNSRGLGEGQLGGALRLAFSADDFKETVLYRETGAWSAKTGNTLWINPGNPLS